jgi:hypothetical protein
LSQLASAQAMMSTSPPRLDGCNLVGEAQNRLFGEPGLFEIQPAWSDLRDAADALQAVCGQAILLAQTVTGSLAVEQARSRWQNGVVRESEVACDHLRAAAVALRDDAPC